MAEPGEAPAGSSADQEPLVGTRRSIAKGGAWNTFAWLVTNACGAVNTILLVRSMSHSEYGVLVMAGSSTAIVTSLAGFGLAPAVAQLSPSAGPGGAWTVLRHAKTVSLVIAAVVAVLSGAACVGLGLDGYQELAAALAIMIPIGVVAPFSSSLIGFLQAVQQPKRLSRALLVAPVVLTGSVIGLCLTSHPSARWVASARAAAALVAVGFLLLAVSRVRGSGLSMTTARPPQGAVASVVVAERRSTTGTPAASRVSLKRMLVIGGSLLGGTVTAILVAQFDVLVLGFSRGREAAALYGPASLVADNALTMAATVGSFYLPTIAAVLARNEVDRAGDLYRWASRWTLVWVAPVIAVMLTCPRAVLSLLFGGAYVSMATPLRILSVGVLVNVVFGFNGLTVDSLNRVKLIVGRQAVALVYNVAACAVLVPRFGANGAAIATSSSLLVMNVTGSALLYGQIRITPHNPKLFAVAAALAAAVGVGLLLGDISMAGVLRLALVGGLAAALCGAASYVASSSAERRAIKNGVGRALAKVAPGYLSDPAV